MEEMKLNPPPYSSSYLMPCSLFLFFYLELNFNAAFFSLILSCLALAPTFLAALQQVALPATSGVGGMVRPVTGSDIGIRRAEIRPGLREIILCKDQDKKVGLRLRAIDNVSLRRETL